MDRFVNEDVVKDRQATERALTCDGSIDVENVRFRPK